MKLIAGENWLVIAILVGLIILDASIDYVVIQSLTDRVEVLETDVIDCPIYRSGSFSYN